MLLPRCFLLAAIALSLTSCEQVAIMFTPKKMPAASHSQLADTAEKNFWETLHKGNYAGIPETEKLLTAAYLQNPNDPALAAHLGFIHIWKITERERLQTMPPAIVNEIILSRKYFADAAALDPDDARFQGFLGDSMLVEGQIFHDQREQVRGYFQLKHAIRMWPQFNYFTAGYPMSTKDPRSDEFREAMEWQWRTLDICAGTRIDRQNPDYHPYMGRETQQGPMRACWNSWIAPHNFEGFFLNMGDMLVKQGDPQTAVKIYNNAKLGKDYAGWPYRGLLEAHERLARQNAAGFRRNSGRTPETRIMFDSGYGCVVCHQAR